jgi:hypothetical protein
MRYLATKGRKIRPLRLAPMDWTYRDAPVDRERHSFSCSKIVTPRSAHSHHLEGSSQLGESCRAPIGLVLAVGLGPDPGFPSAPDEGALAPHAVAISAWTCQRGLDPWGVQKGFWGKAGFGPVDRGARGPSGGPSSCPHRSRNLRRRHPSGPPRVIDTRGPVQPRPPHRRRPFLCQDGDEVGIRPWKTAHVAR